MFAGGMFTYDELAECIANEYVTGKKHPTDDLWVLCYTKQTQYEWVWNNVTANCRGLILNKLGEVVARPFSKFFNMGETSIDQTAFDKPPVVYDKLDGCFLSGTKLNLWDGGTISIGEIVRQRLSPTLIGRDKNGKLVPTKVVDWHNNGTKDNWLEIELDCPVSLKSGGRGVNKLRITSNHEVVANGTWVRAGELHVGSQMVTYEKVLDAKALHVVRSGLLGDGSVSCTHNAFRYQENHSTAQWPYVAHVKRWLGNSVIETADTVSGFGSAMRWANTVALKSLKDIRDEWYPSGIKVVPSDLDWMDDFSVAKWYMDDGSLSHSDHQYDRACFATDSFTKEDSERLGQKLSDMYGVSTSVQSSKGKFSLRVNAGREHSIDNMWRAISPHIVPEMRFKLPVHFRSVPYIPRESGSVVLETKIATVRSVSALDLSKNNFPHGRTGYDITTETGNYFAKGVLVHNSLGIIYKSSRGYEVATKGSFVSEHAEWATQWLNDHYPTFSQPDNVTTLVEIISPDLRICLDYGSREELVLIAAIDNETGEDIPIHKIDWWPGTVVQELTLLGDMHKAAQHAQSAKYADREGIVMVWPRAGESAYRLKVKHPEYVRLHGIITNFSVKKVWEVLADGGDFLALLESVPDEFYQLVYSTVQDLHRQHDRIWATAAVDYANIAHHKERAEFAVHAKLTTYPGLVFALRDGKSIEPMVWKMIKPTGKTQLP